MDVKLKAKTASEARREISQNWPNIPVTYTGYDKNGLDVLQALVREKGNKSPVATAKRNRSLPAVSLVAHIGE